MADDGAVIQRQRLTPEQTEKLRRRVWMLRARGMSYTRIGKIVHRSPSSVRYHLSRARANAYDYLQGVGEEEVVGEMILCHQELRNEAMRNMAKTEPGSASRIEWLREARQTLRQEREFLFDIGLLKKTPDKVDVHIADVRNMSVDEIRKERARLQRELAIMPIKGMDAVDDDVFDVPMNGKTSPQEDEETVFFDQ